MNFFMHCTIANIKLSVHCNLLLILFTLLSLFDGLLQSPIIIRYNVRYNVQNYNDVYDACVWLYVYECVCVWIWGAMLLIIQKCLKILFYSHRVLRKKNKNEILLSKVKRNHPENDCMNDRYTLHRFWRLSMSRNRDPVISETRLNQPIWST